MAAGKSMALRVGEYAAFTVIGAMNQESSSAVPIRATSRLNEKRETAAHAPEKEPLSMVSPSVLGQLVGAPTATCSASSLATAASRVGASTHVVAARSSRSAARTSLMTALA